MNANGPEEGEVPHGALGVEDGAQRLLVRPGLSRVVEADQPVLRARGQDGRLGGVEEHLAGRHRGGRKEGRTGVRKWVGWKTRKQETPTCPLSLSLCINLGHEVRVRVGILAEGPARGLARVEEIDVRAGLSWFGGRNAVSKEPTNDRPPAASVPYPATNAPDADRQESRLEGDGAAEGLVVLLHARRLPALPRVPYPVFFFFCVYR